MYYKESDNFADLYKSSTLIIAELDNLIAARAHRFFPLSAVEIHCDVDLIEALQFLTLYEEQDVITKQTRLECECGNLCEVRVNRAYCDLCDVTLFSETSVSRDGYFVGLEPSHDFQSRLVHEEEQLSVPGSALERLSDFMLSAFNENELEQFLLFRMNTKLKLIVSQNANMRDSVFQILTHFNSIGQIGKLIVNLKAKFPDHSSLPSIQKLLDHLD